MVRRDLGDGRLGGRWRRGRVHEVELLELGEEQLARLVDGGEVAVVEGVRVLLHEHDDAVEDKVDGVRPGPVAPEGEADDAGHEGGLPNVLDDPSRSIPVEIVEEDEFLDDPTDSGEAAHDSI